MHDMWFQDYASGKPTFLRYSSFIPEYAVLTESELAEVMSVTIPASPEPPETLTDEQKISKRYLQHLVRKYEVRLAEHEKKQRKDSFSDRSSLLSSFEDAPSDDYSLMKSIDVILPPERLWIVIFMETDRVDRGISHWAATRMTEKLEKHNIPNIGVEISPSSYQRYTGFAGQRFCCRFDKGNRRAKALKPAKRNKKHNNIIKASITDVSFTTD
jgi:hypothetical protein